MTTETKKMGAIEAVAQGAIDAYKPPLNHGASLMEAGKLYGAMEVLVVMAHEQDAELARLRSLLDEAVKTSLKFNQSEKSYYCVGCGNYEEHNGIIGHPDWCWAKQGRAILSHIEGSAT